MRAAIDTNVLVSAGFNSHTPPGQIVQAWRQGAFELVTSRILLSELEAVLKRTRIRNRLGWSESEADAVARGFVVDSIVVEPSSRLAIVRGEADNRVLEAAVAGEADYIVTGDKDLLDLGSHQSIEIVTPARFAAILAAENL